MTVAEVTAEIRRATFEDIDAIVAMGKRFHENSPYADHFALDPDRCVLTVEWLLKNGAIFVAERDGELVAMLGVTVMPHLMSGVYTATEVFWWVDLQARGLGLKLLRTAERWAKANGAEAFTLIAPDERAERLYERLRYQKVETAYTRRLGE